MEGSDTNPNPETYRQKRDFSKTPEPPPSLPRRGAQGGRGRFVIQKHAASHLHYDFRLEMDGALKSWAVPKGPPYNTAEKRLAMATEDHPIEYLDFEGIIPKGQYGGGTVMVWDIGTYELIDGNYHKGHLHIYLEGKKLRGEWHLVRTKQADGRSWLLIKAGSDMRPVSAKRDDSSALSGRTMAQIAKAALVTAPKAAPQHEPGPKLKSLPTAKLDFVEPMMAKLVGHLPEGGEWQYEIKLDGYRALCVKNAAGKVTLFSRRGNRLNEKFPLAAAFDELPDGSIVDGEIVVLDAEGRPSFNALQNWHRSEQPIYFYAFDLLAYRGKDVRGLLLRERRRLLEEFALKGMADPVRISQTFRTSAADLVAAAREQGLEGVIAKRADSVYQSGERTGAWVKYKTHCSQELVIGGYTPGSHGFDALLVGYYKGDELIFISKVRNGFDPALREQIARRFPLLETNVCPFANLPEKLSARRGEALTTDVMKKCHWLKPTLVAQFEFAEWTAADHLRHARFAGLRDDKEPREVIKEVAA
ncbi:MAG: ATP-dependent DNA ligase [Acidobacteria bacterium]|nr:ATP-dependent DNA ligase [Acidobacteriota bacterium]